MRNIVAKAVKGWWVMVVVHTCLGATRSLLWEDVGVVNTKKWTFKRHTHVYKIPKALREFGHFLSYSYAFNQAVADVRWWKKCRHADVDGLHAKIAREKILFDVTLDSCMKLDGTLALREYVHHCGLSLNSMSLEEVLTHCDARIIAVAARIDRHPWFVCKARGGVLTSWLLAQLAPLSPDMRVRKEAAVHIKLCMCEYLAANIAYKEFLTPEVIKRAVMKCVNEPDAPIAPSEPHSFREIVRAANRDMGTTKLLSLEEVLQKMRAAPLITLEHWATLYALKFSFALWNQLAIIKTYIRASCGGVRTMYTGLDGGRFNFIQGIVMAGKGYGLVPLPMDASSVHDPFAPSAHQGGYVGVQACFSHDCEHRGDASYFKVLLDTLYYVRNDPQASACQAIMRTEQELLCQRAQNTLWGVWYTMLDITNTFERYHDNFLLPNLEGTTRGSLASMVCGLRYGMDGDLDDIARIATDVIGAADTCCVRHGVLEHEETKKASILDALVKVVCKRDLCAETSKANDEWLGRSIRIMSGDQAVHLLRVVHAYIPETTKHLRVGEALLTWDTIAGVEFGKERPPKPHRVYCALVDAPVIVHYHSTREGALFFTVPTKKVLEHFTVDGDCMRMNMCNTLAHILGWSPYPITNAALRNAVDTSRTLLSGYLVAFEPSVSVVHSGLDGFASYWLKTYNEHHGVEGRLV